MKFRTRSNRRRLIRALVLGLATAAIAAPGASALIPDDPAGYGPNQGGAPTIGGTQESSEARALRLRSEGLNQKYGLGETAEARALRLRSEGLNQQHGVSSSSNLVGHRDYADGNIPNVAPSDSGTRLVSDDFEWAPLAIGVASGLVLFSMFAALTVVRRGRIAHS